MNKKILNLALFLILSLVTITILPACNNSNPIDDIEGYWFRDDSSLHKSYEVLIITKDTLAVNDSKPNNFVITEKNDFIILTYPDNLTANFGRSRFIKIIDKNTFKTIFAKIESLPPANDNYKTFTRIDEVKAKELIKTTIKAKEDYFKPIQDPF